MSLKLYKVYRAGQSSFPQTEYWVHYATNHSIKETIEDLSACLREGHDVKVIIKNG